MQRKIYEFTVRWRERFEYPGTDPRELCDPAMETECRRLGFRCDLESRLTERYGRSWPDPGTLEPQLAEERNLFLLGSALYTRWKNFEEAGSDGREMLLPPSRRWFLLVLGRMAVLAGENQPLFEGTLQQLHLVSSRVLYGGEPSPQTEAQQSLSLSRDGRMVLITTGFGTAAGPGSQLRHLEEQIPAFQGALITDAVGEYFSQNVPRSWGSDQGDWELTLINTLGQRFTFQGDLGAKLRCANAELTELLRSCLEMDDLIAFAGEETPERVQSVYVRVLHQLGEFRETEEASEIFSTAEHTLLVDRQDESLTLTEKRFNGSRAVHTFCPGSAVPEFLDKLDPEKLLAEKPKQPDDLIPDPGERWTYEIRVTLRQAGQRCLSGSFDRYGLPRDYSAFAGQTVILLRDFSGSILLKPSFYGRDRQRASDAAVCSVEFPGSSRRYDYLTVRSDYRVGDRVLVPVGPGNQTTAATIRQIRYVPVTETRNPGYPMKYILGKADDPPDQKRRMNL